MKKNIITLFLATVVGLLQAQIPIVSGAVKSEAPAIENALLWKITGNGLKQNSYLFGTIHLIPKADFRIPPNVDRTFKDCQQVVFEVNMEEMTDQSAQIGLLMKSMMRGDSTLKDLVSPADYKLLEAEFEKMKMPLAMFERMKPMFLSAMMVGDGKPMPADEGMNMDDMKSYEVELMQLAQMQNKTIKGLETIDFQMSVFDSIPYKTQAKMLIDGLKSKSSGDDEYKKMVELYKKQDINAMQKVFGDDQTGMAAFEGLLLVRRNKAWIATMEKMMSKNPCFFAVGAGHLGGTTGVVALLRKEGYDVRAEKQ